LIGQTPDKDSVDRTPYTDASGSRKRMANEINGLLDIDNHHGNSDIKASLQEFQRDGTINRR